MYLYIYRYLIKLDDLTETEFEVVAKVGNNLHSLILSDLDNHTLENLQLLNYGNNFYQTEVFVKYYYLDKFSTINLNTTSSKVLTGLIVRGSLSCG